MSKGVLIAVGAVAAGAAVLFMGGGTAHASQPNALPPAGGKTGPNPPPDVINEIAQAMSTADPATIRRTADDVEKKGFPVNAADMRAVATALENAGNLAKQSTPVPGLTQPLPPLPTVPPIPAGTVGKSTTINTPFGPVTIPGNGSTFTLPGVGTVDPATGNVFGPNGVIVGTFNTTTGQFTPAGGGAPGPQPAPPAPGPMPPNLAPLPLALANQLVINVANNPRGSEDRDLVTAFQVQEKSRGHYSGRIDGIYGPGTALALAQDFNIIPPKPMYFAKNPTPGKQAYTKALQAMAVTDPARAAEWIAASDVKNI